MVVQTKKIIIERFHRILSNFHTSSAVLANFAGRRLDTPFELGQNIRYSPSYTTSKPVLPYFDKNSNGYSDTFGGYSDETVPLKLVFFFSPRRQGLTHSGLQFLVTTHTAIMSDTKTHLLPHTFLCVNQRRQIPSSWRSFRCFPTKCNHRVVVLTSTALLLPRPPPLLCTIVVLFEGL